MSLIKHQIFITTGFWQKKGEPGSIENLIKVHDGVLGCAWGIDGPFVDVDVVLSPSPSL